jgi:hypothetical protein
VCSLFKTSTTATGTAAAAMLLPVQQQLRLVRHDRSPPP